jgi:phage tail protein X
MIFSDSRYANGTVVKSYDAFRARSHTTVLRSYGIIDGTFSTYTWEEGDRIDVVANKLRANQPKFWEQILDANPEIANPATIAPGTVIRIPQLITVSGNG